MNKTTTATKQCEFAPANPHGRSAAQRENADRAGIRQRPCSRARPMGRSALGGLGLITATSKPAEAGRKFTQNVVVLL